MRQIIAAGALALAGLSAAACSSVQAHTPTTPTSVTIHGTVRPDVSGAARYYQACAYGKPSPGAQVTVTDPSGAVISTGTLGAWSHANPSGMFTCAMPFTVANVPHEARYGFAINGVPGTIWKTSVGGTVQLEVSSNG